jgi:3'-phosphoadenosine 5'-phosphosulfate sulfotransferase (PAPS reductase)/FAD synthetase
VKTNLSADAATAYAIADNRIPELAEWDEEILAATIEQLKEKGERAVGFDEDMLAALLSRKETPVPPAKVDSVDVDTLKVLERADRVVVQFSGGKDSTLALSWASGVCRDLGKPLEAVFVETGAEYPDLTSHVIRICERLGVELKLLYPSENIAGYYFRKREWPDSIYRDCQHRFINDPCNRYLRQFEAEHVIVVRGGRPDQKTTRSKSTGYQEVQDGGRVVRLLNPFFGSRKSDYERALDEVEPLLWRGYDHGFLRTACWMCPFQRAGQWEALRRTYPLVWEEMRELAEMLKWKRHKGDTTPGRFRKYWKGQQAAA